jgi:proteasome accessory factor B
MAETSMVERQIHILSVLSESRNGYTVEEIFRNLQRLGIDVNKKTITRDIEEISRHFPVCEEKSSAGEACYKADKLKISNITFTIPELISLYFLKQLIKQYEVLDVGKTAAELIQKMLQNAPPIHQIYIDSISDLLKVNPSEVVLEKNIDEAWMQTIREAIEKKRRLKIDYFSFNNDEMTSRTIDPYFLEIREGCYHLVGLCHLREEIRDFRVSRIRGLELLSETFKRPENFYEEYNRNRFEKMTGDEQITLKIVFEGQAARYIKEYEQYKADKITDLDKGKILFEKKTTYTPDIVQWVLRFGADAEVLEPEDLKFEITWEVQRMIRRYGKK